MLKRALFALAVVAVASCNERTHAHKYVDPISRILSYYYPYPLTRAVIALDLDAEDYLVEPKFFSDSEKFEVNLNVRRYKPEELKIRIKNRNIIVEGEHKETNKDDQPFVANHFVQQFIMPAGSKQEEVTAVLKENGTLTITVPRHEVPPPPPEREVPIEVLVPEKKTEDRTVKPELEQGKTKEETTNEEGKRE